ncbi:Methionine aminopeptidase [Zea mays]|uniref:Methionine aminopeptidase n=1 Tax=Zea mays TaxID=4577 RepID=A0A1D6EWS6_MAIZE|nr:Methionine aminopeptidase [Zea mays]
MAAGLGARPSATFVAGRFRPLAAPLRPVRSGKFVVPKRCFIVSSRLAWVEDELMEIQKSQEQSSVKSKKRPPLRRGKVSPQLPVPGHIPRPSYVGAKGLPELCKGQLHDAQGITGMRAACKLAARVLDFAGTLVKNGDIINIDVNVFLNGYHGGTSRTFACGQVDDSIKHFLNAAEECLEKGISICRDGVNYRKIGKKISKLAYFYGYYVVERFVGHGIGTMYHSEPLILHHGGYHF